MERNGTALAPMERARANEAAVLSVAKFVQHNYVVKVQGRSYMMVAGASSVAQALGYTTGIESARHIPAADGLAGYWEAVAVVYADGVVVGRGVGSVFDDERPWNSRPQFARQAMAQTRATGRALKGVMGWACALIGAETSLAEEMPAEDATMPQDASDAPKRLPEPPNKPTPPKAVKDRWITAVVAAVEEHQTNGQPWWKLITEGEDGTMDSYTCFRPTGAKSGWSPSALVGKRADLKLSQKTRKDGTTGVVVVDAIDASELPV